jgi:glycosyltransferase involved in cell wall biosynthesis
MKIGIDISQSVYRGTGVGRYTTSLIKGLMKYGTENDYTLFFSSLRQPIPQEILSELNDNTVIRKFNFPPLVLNYVWNTLHKLPIEQLIGDVDVFYSSDWVEPPTKKAKKITTIHDLALFKFPGTTTEKTTLDLRKMRFSQNILETHTRRLSWVKKESDIVICSSEATKEDAQVLLGIPKEKLRVVYLGVEMQEPSQSAIDNIKKKYELKHPYILTVGTVQPRKNIQRLINAFEKAQLENMDLYIVGMKGWGEAVETTNKNIKFLGFVPDNELAALYKESLFFVFPSLYEGFGYPIVEAMMMKKAVASSNTSSMKEITEGYGLLFDPTSEDEMAAAITRLATDTELRKSLEEKSEIRAKDFTLEIFIKNFLSVFKEFV